MDLIDRAAVMGVINKAVEEMGCWSELVDGAFGLKKLPTIEAVPLDALCDWLAAQDFIVKGEPIVAKLDKETWKNVIRECVMKDATPVEKWDGEVAVGPDGLPW